MFGDLALQTISTAVNFALNECECYTCVQGCFGGKHTNQLPLQSVPRHRTQDSIRNRKGSSGDTCPQSIIQIQDV